MVSCWQTVSMKQGCEPRMELERYKGEGQEQSPGWGQWSVRLTEVSQGSGQIIVHNGCKHAYLTE